MTWKKTAVDAQLVKEIARRYEIDLLPATILARRGITTPEQTLFFLENDPRFVHNPFLMPAMGDAVERINAAIDSGEKVLIFGDRDVDGITATVLLFETLSELGGDVRWMLPEGEDAYGLTEKTIEKAAADSVALLVTVDCGVSNCAEITLAAARGIDCIVIDHHNPPEELPPAVAVVNPKLRAIPSGTLCGCAVAAKVEWALRFSHSPFYGASFCLLNARPANETLVVEAVRLTNLVETGASSKVWCPGMVALEKTRLASFIAGDEILVLDAAQQAQLFAKTFGPEAALPFSDIGPLLSQFLSERAGKSLLKIQQSARSARYRSRPLTEIDTLADTSSPW